MDLFSAFLTIIIAAILHASFQLSLGLLLSMNASSIGRGADDHRVLKLNVGFVLGGFVAILSLLAFIAMLVSAMSLDVTSLSFVWAVCSGLLVGLGISVWLLHLRKDSRSAAWLPVGISKVLMGSVKLVKSSPQAAQLAIVAAILELIFTIIPVTIVALTLVELSTNMQLLGMLLYAVITTTPLMTVLALVGSGHTVSRLLKWSKTNQGFMRLASGGGLIIFGIYIYAEHVAGGVSGMVVGG